MPNSIDALLEKVKTRFSELRPDSSAQKNLLLHLESLARWNAEPMDYPPPSKVFPSEVLIASATCHPECGAQEFIVDGSTQECQRCGGLMFRHSVASYSRKDEKET